MLWIIIFSNTTGPLFAYPVGSTMKLTNFRYCYWLTHKIIILQSYVTNINLILKCETLVQYAIKKFLNYFSSRTTNFNVYKY